MRRGMLIAGMALMMVGAAGAQSDAQASEPNAGAGPGAPAPATAAGREGAAIFELSVVPQTSIPLGQSRDLFTTGGGGSLSGHLRLGALPWLAPTAETAYSVAPVQADVTLSLLRAGAGLEASWRPEPRFAAHGFATAGGFYGMLDGSETGNAAGFAYRVGAGVSYRLTPTFGLTAGTAYSSYPGLYDGLSAFVGTRLTFGDDDGFRQGPDIRIREPEFDTIFPVLFKYYDENALGRVEIVNTGRDPVENVEVSVEVPQYMDTPKTGARVARLEPGESTTVDLTALFTDEVLTITEGTRVAARITARHEGVEVPAETATTLSTYDRNALRWDDDRKIAAFVTARDDEIQAFAKNVASLSRDLQIDAVNREFQLAMAQFTAFVEHGTSYVVDPQSAYEELSQNPLAVDYVQFPRQTLQFRAGDCDDLSATCAAMMEAVGIDTAFITVPGHLFMAFRLDMPAEQARLAFSNPEDLIFREDGTVWVPVETTVLDGGFAEAWATGARQWREHSEAGTAGFFTTREAWGTYQPVAFNVSDINVLPPQDETVAAAFERELDAFVDRELYQRERRYVARLRENPGDLRTRNRLAVLYGRYGRYEEAREQLLSVLRNRPDHVPARVNLGNIAFAAGNHEEARGHYEQALEVAPENPAALLGATRAANELEDIEGATTRYERLASVSPDLAERFSHLGPGEGSGTARAAEAATNPAAMMIWEDEE